MSTDHGVRGRRAATTIRLRRFWNHYWEGATCPPEALHDLRWANHRTFGESSWFGPKMLTALVSCADVQEVNTIHIGSHGPCPHTIRVIIAGVDNPTKIYRHFRDLAQAADEAHAARFVDRIGE